MRGSVVVHFRVITEAAEIIRISIISVFYVELYVFSRRIMMKDWVGIWIPPVVESWPELRYLQQRLSLPPSPADERTPTNRDGRLYK